MTLWVWAAQDKSQSYNVWWPDVVMLCYWRESLIVSHQSVKFDGHRQYGSGDIMILVVEGQDSTCSLKSIITFYL